MAKSIFQKPIKQTGCQYCNDFAVISEINGVRLFIAAGRLVQQDKNTPDKDNWCASKWVNIKYCPFCKRDLNTKPVETYEDIITREG